jgi:glycosyltransferase involved in cell wall biosynthesis
MPVYNGQDFVADAIDSVLSQTFDSFELIIINDGSTDQSEAIIQEYLPHDKIRYFTQENRGFAETVNRAVREATGEFLTIHPQDDFSLPERFETQIPILKEHPDVGLVYSPAQYIDFDGNELSIWGGWKGEGRVSGRELFYKLYVDGMFIASPAVVFRRDHIQDDQQPWGDPELQVVSDWEHWLEACRHYDAYEQDEFLIKMLRDPDHDYLGGRRELVLREERIVLRRLRDKYAESSIPVTDRHYARAMSNHYLRELKYRLGQDGEYRKTAEAVVKTFSHNPFNRRLYFVLAKRLRLFPG